MKNIFSFTKVRSPKSRGFTLIEMLVVIAIIAILTGIVMTSLTGSKSKARDAKRISDIGQLQFALALYYDRCKMYPWDLHVLDNSLGLCPESTINLGKFISVLPIVPGTSLTYNYARDYNVGGCNPSAPTIACKVVDYVLYIDLENDNEALKDDIDGRPLSNMTPGADDNFCGVPNNGVGTNSNRYCVGPK